MKFKPGDRVRCVKQNLELKVGEEFVVLGNVPGKDRLVIVLRQGREEKFFEERFELVSPAPKPIVIIESPLAGDVEANKEYARRAMLDSLRRGEAPYASHLLYTQCLDDEKPEERELGMAAGIEFTAKADLVAVYVDRGVSSGMKAGIARAKELGKRIEIRSLEIDV